MSDKGLHFIDSNVWLYALVAGQDICKQQRAKELVQVVEERFRKASVRSHARLAAASLNASERSGSKNQCPVPL